MILDGKVVAASIKQRLKEEIEAQVAQGKRAPHLVIVTVGDDPASAVYVRNKMKMCDELGIKVTHAQWTKEYCPAEEIKANIRAFNGAPLVDGIMVQLPLPEGFDERDIIDTIDPDKDVDGLTTTNIGRLRSGQPGFKPCTAKGIIDMCRYYNIELDARDVVIVGRSNIVGKPLADLMMAEGATVTQCHSRTRCLSYHMTCADIVVTAIGKPKYFNHSYFAAMTDAIIDVGINRDENGKLCGDVDFEDMKDRCDAITPVPGGVGPMTVVELMANTVESWRQRI